MLLELLHLLQCIAIYSACSTHCLGFLERHTTSVILVLIFIPAWLHEAENRWSALWRLCCEDVNSTTSCFKRNTVVWSIELDKTWVDVFGLLQRFLKICWRVKILSAVLRKRRKLHWVSFNFVSIVSRYKWNAMQRRLILHVGNRLCYENNTFLLRADPKIHFLSLQKLLSRPIVSTTNTISYAVLLKCHSDNFL